MIHLNIHFVCAANTCRSAMAEAIAKEYISENGLNMTVSSSGINAFCADAATENAISVLKDEGIDLSEHRSQRFDPLKASSFDYIFFMTALQQKTVTDRYPELDDICYRLSSKDIPDPYGLGIEEYRQTAIILRDVIKEKLDMISKEKPLIKKADMKDIGAIETEQSEAFSHPLSRKDLEAYEKDLNYCIKCIYIGKRPVGHYVCYFIFDTCELQSVAIDPSHRGLGLGEMLIDNLISTAKEMGCNRILLEVRQSNVPARQLYLKKGFTEIALRKGFYDSPAEDGITMELKI